MRTALAFTLCGLLFPGSLTPAPQGDPASADVSAGKRIFERHCALCHGMDGKGGRGPGLNRAQLLHAPDDTALKSLVAEGIAPEMPGAWFLSEEEVTKVAAYVRSLGKVRSDPLPGDPARGARVYASSGCARCHIFAGEGFGYGPELTGISERRSASHIREAILKPSARLPEGFLLVRATTGSRQTLEGIRVNEDTFSIQMKDATGRFYSLRKRDLKELEKLRGKSPMPSYEGILDSATLDDLVAYLASQQGKP